MCICFLYNHQINLCHFFQDVNLDFLAFNAWYSLCQATIQCILNMESGFSYSVEEFIIQFLKK